jgi:hypothetical protein
LATVVDDDGSFVVIDEGALYEAVDYIPHPGQRAQHRAMADHRFTLTAAGRRFGKSQIGGNKLTLCAFQAEAIQSQLEPKGLRHEYWIVGPEYSDSEKEFRVVYNNLTKLGAEFDRPGTYYSQGGGDMDISLFGGRFQIHAKSAKYPDTLVGERLKGVVMAEAAKLKEVVWTKYIRPTLADFARDDIPSWAMFNSTPEGKNWYYRLYMRGRSNLNADSQWWGQRRPSWDNTFLFPDGAMDPEILEMKADMSDEMFKQEVVCEFTDFVGRVFKDFAEETHVGLHPYNPRWPVYVASDKGWRAPSVVLFVQQDVFNNIWVCGEYYKPDRTAQEIGEDIKADPWLRPMAEAARELYPDPASPEWAAELADAFNWRIQGGTGGDLDPRLNLIRRYLRPQPLELEDGHPEKIPKLLFDQRCVNTIRDFNDYRYPETRNEQVETPSEKPLKKDDHAPEALGRFFIGHLGKQELPTAKARVSHARLRSRTR